MNYFEFYGLEEKFFIDEAELKRKFYQKSKELHPDFHTMSDPAAQMEKLQLSSVNNQAFKKLKSLEGRIDHILDLHGVKDEEGKATVPQEFLMEMMELNESLMDLEMDPSEELRDKARAILDNWYDDLWKEVEPILNKWDEGHKEEGALEKVKDYLLKKKYLNRIAQRLSGEVEL